MILDEAINFYERQTEALYKAIPCDGCAFQKCKEENEQLVEWLRELKAYRDGIDNLIENETIGSMIDLETLRLKFNDRSDSE